MISFLFLSIQFVIQAVILDHDTSYTLLQLQRTAIQTLEVFFLADVLQESLKILIRVQMMPQKLQVYS